MAKTFHDKGDMRMAFIQINFMSQALMRSVPVNVILPVDKFEQPGKTSTMFL